jgi:hypothetical protein
MEVSMRGHGGGAVFIVLGLGLATSLSGCFGTLVRFTGPEGASVRIDDGPMQAIPCASRVDSGIHAVEIRARAGGSDPASSARGVLLLLEPRGWTFPDVRLEDDELARALAGSAYSTTFQDARWREVGFLKISAAGVPKDDWEVRRAIDRANERASAVVAERSAKAEQKRSEAREKRAALEKRLAERPPPTAGEIVLRVLGAILLLGALALYGAGV